MNNQKEGGKSIVGYTCKNCFQTWTQKESFLKHHLEICNGSAPPPKYHTCQFCNKSFNYQGRFNYHVKICAKRSKWLTSNDDDAGASPKYQCDECLKTFADWRWFRYRHKCKSQQIKTCYYCNKIYTTQVHFDKHVKICASSKWRENKQSIISTTTTTTPTTTTTTTTSSL